jgi:transketolase
MDNLDKITMRDAFWDKIYELAKENSDIVVVAADCGAPSLDKFRKNLSGQFVKTGIAEANSILVATGMALAGKKVFAYAIAPFITLRAYEQIKVNLAGMKLPVTIVGVGAGFSYEDSGPTHHTIEDLSVMRILPNMTINSISDNVMAQAVAESSCKMDSPNYVRLDREMLPMIYNLSSDFSQGLSVLNQGKDLWIVATGNMVHRALEVSKELGALNVQAGVIDLHRLPINQNVFLEKVGDAKRIITLEEHTLPGGLGSAVAEVLADNNKFISLKRIGLDCRDGYCYRYGGRKNIQSLCGLDKENIVKRILEVKN